MRKRLINLVLFFLLFVITSVVETTAQEITLGVPYTSTSYYPYYYQNSYAEFIIHKGQLGPDPITIERLSFLPWSISRSNMHSMGEVSIYMKLTSDSLVVSSPTYNLSDYQLVYEPNPLEIRGWYNEWIDYNLDSEFEYDGEHNISVVIHHQAPESRSSSYYYLAANYVYYGYGYITRYGYNSSSMTAAPTSYGTASYIPYMKINRDDMKSPKWTAISDNDHALAYSYNEGYRGGSGNNLYMYYDYGAYECQYGAAMLGNQPRTINKLRFYVMYRNGTIGGQSQRFKIYLKNDVPSSLAYGASCNQSVDTSDYTKVFDGTYTISQTYGNFWQEIELDEPFYYDGSSNLYMLFVTNTGSYLYNYNYFFTFNNPSYSGRYTYSSYYPNWQYGTNYFPMCDFVGPA
ncbi:MAG: hypothetical protein IJK61_05050, partial [Bacteroidetes bacterium]|nr:hypothetical protein [Bacteroidota bacterium]